MPVDARTQLEDFRAAAAELGGATAAARAIGIAARSLRDLIADPPRAALTPRHLRQIARALTAKADRCRVLERSLSPAFAGNLTPRQQTPDGRARRYDRMDLQNGSSIEFRGERDPLAGFELPLARPSSSAKRDRAS